MNEAEWLNATSPGRMIWFTQKRFKDRKRHLFAAACLRRIWDALPGEASRYVVAVLERFADSQAHADELVTAREAARKEAYTVNTGGNRHPGEDAAIAASYDDPEYVAMWAVYATETSDINGEVEEAAQTGLVREIFGNPFHPVTFDPAWRTSDVTLLARGIYDDRAFDRMPILADALQDAGCNSDELLNHFRDTTVTHVRGCWALDLVLGKE